MPAARGSRLVILNWRDRRHPAAGAAELYCERVAREFARRGRSVVLVTSRPAGTEPRERTDGYDIRRLGGEWTVYPLALLWLLRHRSSIGAVVDSQNGIPFFSPLVIGRHTPVVLLVHHVHQDLFGRALRPLAARLARWLEGPASRHVYRRRTVIALSPSARAAVRRRLRFDGPIRVVPCGADSLGARPRRSVSPRVVVVGRLTPLKRLEWLIDAMARVQQQRPDAELHLVGDGPARRDLEDRARAVGAQVVFHGRLSDARRDAVLGSAWLTVSASDGGDWGLSLIEANAAGVPALARRVRGMTDSVRHGRTGWLVDGSSQELGASVAGALATLADPAVARTMAERARTWAARFTWARTAEGVFQALEFEEARLQRQLRGSEERRTGNDLMVVLSVPQSAVREGWESSRRAGDVWMSDGTTVRALLAGADEGDVDAILDRLDVDSDDPAVSVLVARHADVLGHQLAAEAEDVVHLVRASDERGDRHAA
ncbi:Glycosyltransferase involved in cell wall bisynthesis [Modestobacter sp. DSM 44400]|uniref:glycosyltransferase family 4 protein n=1 Tax=Modestobacter sp. DSM 44400 TaxID=1550230 RepID=UPI00089583B4|nr:glycosyltransferase family 4 protein [Modestobacter sp. DSM 44400]SDX96541.1 Glycosyltransferase involved in cell wall bisynthesis [Modestobacter sp. DSM 44400]